MHNQRKLQKQFGQIDVYLFDQLLRGRFDNGRNILDVGCGSGRNLIYFLKNGFNVTAIDRDEKAVNQVQRLARDLAPQLPTDNFRVAKAEEIPFGKNHFDAVICNAVLHFATDESHFEKMLDEMWRVLKKGGLLFCRLASSIGLESRVKQITGRRYLLPDGTERFLVDEALLLDTTATLRAKLADPIKTTNVQNLRCMTTWCLSK